MRVLITLSAVFLFTGCTPALQQSISDEFQTAKEYNYTEMFRDITGIKKTFPNKFEKAEQSNSQLCMHEDAHERHTTVTGVNDEVVYRGCTLSPSLGNQNPQRMDGR